MEDPSPLPKPKLTGHRRPSREMLVRQHARARKARAAIHKLEPWVQAVLYLDIVKLQQLDMSVLVSALRRLRRLYDAGKRPSPALQEQVLKQSFLHFLAQYDVWLQGHLEDDVQGGSSSEASHEDASSSRSPSRTIGRTAPPDAWLYRANFHNWPANPFVSGIDFLDIDALCRAL